MVGYAFAGLDSGTSAVYAAETKRAQYTHSFDGLKAAKRLQLHYTMAQDYYKAYALLAAGENVTYPSWKLAGGAVYWSPYFTPEVDSSVGRPLTSMGEIVQSATYERMAYLMTFPDWGPVEFECWPSMQGFAMRTKFKGTNRYTGEVMSFYTHGYVWTNNKGQITRWETWPEPYGYDKFLSVALGDCGPWQYSCQYYNAVLRMFGRSIPDCPTHVPVH
jgi:hypothetical protein